MASAVRKKQINSNIVSFMLEKKAIVNHFIFSFVEINIGFFRTVFFYWFNLQNKSQTTIPVLTEIFKECFVPN